MRGSPPHPQVPAGGKNENSYLALQGELGISPDPTTLHLLLLISLTTRDGKNALWVKCLLCNYDHLSSGPHYPNKKLCVVLPAL